MKLSASRAGESRHACGLQVRRRTGCTPERAGKRRGDRSKRCAKGTARYGLLKAELVELL